MTITIGRKLVRLLASTLREAGRDNIPFLAAAVAYYGMISIAPLFVLGITITSATLGASFAEGELYAWLSGLIGEQGATAIQGMVQRSRRPGAGLATGIAGGVFLLVGASWFFSALQTALDTVWKIEAHPDRSWFGAIRYHFFAVFMVLLTGFALTTLTLVNAVLVSIAHYFPEVLRGWDAFWLISNHIVGFLLAMLIFGGILRGLSNVRLTGGDVLAGALFASLLFDLGRFALAQYIGRTSFVTVYGAAGSLVVLLLWMYFLGLILCLSAEFIKLRARARGVLPRPRKGLRFSQKWGS